MRFLIAVVTSYSLVSLQLAESQDQYRKREQPKDSACNDRSPWISTDYEGLTIFRYFYNSTLDMCVDDFVPSTYTGGFDTFYECVSKCGTGEGAPYCAEEPKFRCGNSSKDCFHGFRFNITSGKCVESDTLTDHRIYEPNFFATLQSCEYSCKGFTSATVKGTKRNKP
uniref:Putative kunitz-type peptidase inhibitor n=1 Tax=Amblyomma americanum TaxID=6943 RepID=A0A0C9SF86_AMBAM